MYLHIRLIFMSLEINKKIWACCPDDLLWQHFFSDSTSPPLKHVRVLLKRDKLGSITNQPLQISMTLSTTIPGKQEFTFKPKIELDSEGIYFPIKEKKGGGESVDKCYKTMRKAEWFELRSNDIHRVFRIETPCKQCGDLKFKRLLCFKVNHIINTGLYNALNEKNSLINRVDFHMGVNKGNLRVEQRFEFTPIIQLKTKRLNRLDKQYFLENGFDFESGSEDPYFQRLHPCPPFGNCE